MKKKYRLIEITENIDNIIKKDIVIFELTPVEYNSSESGYYFNPEPSTENHFFIYENTQLIKEKFLSENEDIIEMDLNLFTSNLILTPEGIRKTFFFKNLDKKRKAKDFWLSKSTESIKNNKQVAFTFSHNQHSGFTYGDNYENDTMDLIPDDYFDDELENETYHIVIGKNQVVFLFEKNKETYTKIIGKITSIETDENGQLKVIKTLSNWALTNNVPINYEFGRTPISPLNKSNRNLVVSILGKDNEPSIKRQWSLLFGKYVGEVTF